MATKGTNTATNLAKAINGEAITSYASANAYLAVGDSSTAESSSHNDLQASSNKLRKAATVTRSGAVLTAVADYDGNSANYAWNEVGLFNASSSGDMLLRHVPSPSLGTKPSGETWRLTATITVS